MLLRVLTWNLMHGRAIPPAGQDLLEEYATVIAGWEWDVALLQEVPPWWPAALAVRASAEERRVLTSRNALLAMRRAIAIRWPDLIKSNGGGANAILVRRIAITEHRARRLSLLPERRWLHAVALENGVWVGNLHTGSYAQQGQNAAKTMLGWAAGAPVVLGGDFNVAPLSLEGLELAGGHGVDHVFIGNGVERAGATEVLERRSLSDHAPVRVSVGSVAPCGAG